MHAHTVTASPPLHGTGCLCCTPFLQDFTRRISADLSRRAMMLALGASASAVGLGVYGGARAQSEAPAAAPRPTVFTNIRLFDGRADALRDGLAVVVSGDKVTAVQEAAAPLPEGADVIDGRGGVLMPGLIDAHWHAIMTAVPKVTALTADPAYLHIVAAEEAGRTLLRGFTSVRDVGGPAFALKRAIDEGHVSGPRIFPSGAMISQTSGHGDFRSINELPRFPGDPASLMERSGAGMIADGRAEVLRRTREQLMLGATQIKLMAGGGVSSPYDAIEVTQYTEDEMRAAVEAAADYGTYVTVHAYTPQAIQRAIRAGVRCIEHGQLVDDETAALIAETGTMWSLQPFFDDEDANPQPDPVARAKQMQVGEGTAIAYELAKKHGIAVAFGTDVLFDARLAQRQGRMLAKIGRFHSAFEVLKMATSGNARYLEACGIRNPYPAPLGVIEPGAWADMILVDGDPTADLDLVADPDRNFRVIMKNGTLAKRAA
jgi:imidazolonepropionase-like amidohydrolase